MLGWSIFNTLIHISSLTWWVYEEVQPGYCGGSSSFLDCTFIPNVCLPILAGNYIQGCAFACEIRKIRMRSENFAKFRIRIASQSPFRVRINFAKCENIFRMRIFRIMRNFAKCEYSHANSSRNFAKCEFSHANASHKANFRVRFLGELGSLAKCKFLRDAFSSKFEISNDYTKLSLA